MAEYNHSMIVFLHSLLANLADSLLDRLDDWRCRLQDFTITPAMVGAAIVIGGIMVLTECAVLVWILSNL